MKRSSAFRSIVGFIAALAATGSPGLLAEQTSSGQGPLVYVGTYTRGGKSEGIYVYRLNPATGALESLGLAAAATNPSFLAIHPNRKSLYAVSEMAGAGGKSAGGVNAFAIDSATGKLSPLNQQPSGGAGPAHVTVDPSGKVVLVANYGSGSVASLPVRADGSLDAPASQIQHEGSSVNPKRQAGPHAHSVNGDPAGKFAFVADLGLDKVLVYKIDAAKGTLAPNEPPFAKVAPGAGPRHFAFHPSAKFAYVNNEMASSVTAFSYAAARGELKEVQTITTLPPDFSGSNSTAEVQVHPSGKFLYCSNRGHDSIAVFAIDEASGKLTPLEHESSGGKTPRNFGIDPTGAWLLAANQATNNIVVLKIDPKTGKLSPTGQSAEVGSPVCVKFLQPPAK